MLLGALPRNSFVNCACSAFASFKVLEHFRGLTFRQALPAPRLSKRRRGQRNRFGNVDPRELFQENGRLSLPEQNIKRIELAPISSHIWASYFKNNGPPISLPSENTMKNKCTFVGVRTTNTSIAAIMIRVESLIITLPTGARTTKTIYMHSQIKWPMRFVQTCRNLHAKNVLQT